MIKIFLFLLLSACTSIPNIAFHKPLPFDRGARVSHTLKPEMNYTLTQDEWDLISYRATCLMPEAWIELKAALLKLCHLAGKGCTQNINSFDSNMKGMDLLYKELY